MKVVAETEKGITLLVPPYRVDVQRPCDVVEDILRIYGYNNINFDNTLHSSIITKGAEDKSPKRHRLYRAADRQICLR